ncbi:hypothetical protein GM556_08465 [Bombella sp. ESL0378]|uniref:hypothetical protein n=1 Tax=Bombella sp. ESL0378 TaxID=2676442 RepID=UPI0012D8E1FB|nr:hypothetical protein [Bombella sp. ESL0378]MUG05565.1 hypothetical protein [Bombella sp. ESL0378]
MRLRFLWEQCCGGLAVVAAYEYHQLQSFEVQQTATSSVLSASVLRVVLPVLPLDLEKLRGLTLPPVKPEDLILGTPMPDPVEIRGLSTPAPYPGNIDIQGLHDPETFPLPEPLSWEDLIFTSTQQGGKRSHLPVSEPVSVDLPDKKDPVEYKSNPKHTPGASGSGARAGVEPRDVLDLFGKSISSQKEEDDKKLGILLMEKGIFIDFLVVEMGEVLKSIIGVVVRQMNTIH